jgi:hypothetical protein
MAGTWPHGLVIGARQAAAPAYAVWTVVQSECGARIVWQQRRAWFDQDDRGRGDDGLGHELRERVGVGELDRKLRLGVCTRARASGLVRVQCLSAVDVGTERKVSGGKVEQAGGRRRRQVGTIMPVTVVCEARSSGGSSTTPVSADAIAFISGNREGGPLSHMH